MKRGLLMVKRLLSILAALGMSATATSTVIACGQLSADKIIGGEVPLLSKTIKLVLAEAIDFADYVNLSRLDPAAYAQMTITPQDLNQFEYSEQTDDQGISGKYWRNSASGVEYSKIGKVWSFSTISARTSFSTVLLIHVPGYKDTPLSIDVRLSNQTDEVMVNVELRDYLIPKETINQWYQNLGPDADTLIIHAWAKIGEETIVFTPNYGAEPDQDLIATWFQKNKLVMFSLDQIENVVVHFEVLDQKNGEKATKIATFEELIPLLDIAQVE